MMIEHSRRKTPKAAGEPRRSACIWCEARIFRIGSMQPSVFSCSVFNHRISRNHFLPESYFGSDFIHPSIFRKLVNSLTKKVQSCMIRDSA